MGCAKEIRSRRKKKYTELSLAKKIQRLNSVKIPDFYLISHINSPLESLNESKHFTTLDLTSRFHRVSIRDRGIEKTTFSRDNGKYKLRPLEYILFKIVLCRNDSRVCNPITPIFKL